METKKYYKKAIDPDVVNHILIMPRGFGKRIAIKEMKEREMKEKEMKIWKTKKQESK